MKPNFWMPFGLLPKKNEPKPEGPRFADLYERGVAAAVDFTIIYLVLHDLFNAAASYLYGQADHALLQQGVNAPHLAEKMQLFWQSGLLHWWLVNALFQILLIGLFIVGSQLYFHTTPGKYLLGLSVRRKDTLELPSVAQYVLRFVAYIPAAPLFFIITFNRQRRGLHDRIVGTVVIHTRPDGWYWQQVKRGFYWLRARLTRGD